MHPSIQDGDILWVEPLSRASVRLGDVVFYLTSTGRPIVHRVIGKFWGGGLLIKGDSTHRVDGLLPASSVRGTVTSVERGDTIINLRAGQARYRTVLRSWVRWWVRPLVARVRWRRWAGEQPVQTSYYAGEENIDGD
jgi:hypothetical protein